MYKFINLSLLKSFSHLFRVRFVLKRNQKPLFALFSIYFNFILNLLSKLD